MSTGSQFLQVSLTGMVNVLLHSQAITSEVRCGSRWDIWPHSSIPLLARLLDNNAPLSDCDLGGPISRATYYLGRDLITDAATAGAIPWTCIQNPGDALFIPSGCPHQVCLSSSDAGNNLRLILLREGLKPVKLRKSRQECPSDYRCSIASKTSTNATTWEHCN